VELVDVSNTNSNIWFEVDADLTRSNNGSFTLGPPTKDAVLHIKSIDVYFNRTSITGCGS
jgi:hypothetical protein